MVDEVLGFRRFADAEFTADVPPTIVHCDRYIAGSFRRGNEQWPVLGLRSLVEDPAIHRGERMSADAATRGGRAQVLAIASAVLVLLGGRGLHRLPLAASAGLAGGASLALLALAPLAMLFSHLRRAAEAAAQAQRRADAQRLETDRNQQAIMRLLDEMSSLAEGDLTVQATVTEDITGAIADSVNYAVEALRKLVTTISQSGIQLDGAARQTQALASHLARASSAQSKQIGVGHRIDRRDGFFDRRSLGQRRARPPTSRAIRSMSRTRAAMPCGARSTA